MYSESDLDDAVAAGVLSRETAAALRNHVARSHSAPAVDEEHFRLLSGFNDIFVSIAVGLVLAALAWIGMSITPPLAGALVALAAWGLAEYFTRQRRMALPSILLLGTFVFAIGSTCFGLLQFASPSADPRGIALRAALAALLSAAAAWVHWRRFHVPITIAALTGALVVTIQSLLTAILPDVESAWLWLTLASGLVIFTFAMWWDMSDPTRTTRRSDVAFWLHLAAAPMIAHPIFWLLGVVSGSIGAATALLVIGLYVAFGIIALAIDRRALLVSSLFYVLYALAGLFRQFGAVSLNVALTALVIGSALLMLSAFWQPMRRLVVERLPVGLASRLPLLQRSVVKGR